MVHVGTEGDRADVNVLILHSNEAELLLVGLLSGGSKTSGGACGGKIEQNIF